MSLSMYDISVPVMIRGFGIFDTYLDKAAAFAAERNIDPAVLVNARLAPDMLPLAGQVQRASDNAKGAIGRLTGKTMPSFADNEGTLDQLKERIAKTVELLKAVKPKELEGTEDRPIPLTFRSLTGTLAGSTYVLSVLLPNFFFHLATAHDILRHNGVTIGKKDYFGSFST